MLAHKQIQCLSVFSDVALPCQTAQTKRYQLHDDMSRPNQTEADGICQSQYGGVLAEIYTQEELAHLGDFLKCFRDQSGKAGYPLMRIGLRTNVFEWGLVDPALSTPSDSGKCVCLRSR